MAGRIDEARESYTSARSTFRDLSLKLWLHADGTIGPSKSELRAGDPVRAVEMLEQGIEGLGRINAHGTWLVNETELLIRAFVRLGRLADAEAAFARLQVLDQPYGHTRDEWFGSFRGQIAMLRGDAAGAVEHFRVCVEHMEPGWVMTVADVHGFLADALRADGQEVEAVAAARRALEIYRAKGDVVSARRVEEFLDAV
jgi:hypothetical protein